MINLSRLAKPLVLVLSTLSLAGCISLLPEAGPPATLVSLNSNPEPSHISSKKTLVIEEPTGPINYNGTNIIMQKTSPSGLINYTHAEDQEWTERLPKMLQRQMVNHFRTPQWPTVSGEIQSVAPDFRLATDIQKFQILFPGAIEVVLNVTLSETKSLKTLATKTFTYRMDCANTATAYVHAFDKVVTLFLNDSGTFVSSFVRDN